MLKTYIGSSVKEFIPEVTRKECLTSRTLSEWHTVASLDCNLMNHKVDLNMDIKPITLFQLYHGG
jgi:hypothetical protein